MFDRRAQEPPKGMSRKLTKTQPRAGFALEGRHLIRTDNPGRKEPSKRKPFLLPKKKKSRVKTDFRQKQHV